MEKMSFESGVEVRTSNGDSGDAGNDELYVCEMLMG